MESTPPLPPAQRAGERVLEAAVLVSLEDRQGVRPFEGPRGFRTHGVSPAAVTIVRGHHATRLSLDLPLATAPTHRQ